MATIPEAHPVIDASERLCVVLDQIGDALVDLDLEALLASEEALTALVAILPAESVDGLEPQRVAALVQRVRASLLRCQRLGASFGAVARARLQTCAGSEGYGEDGDYIEHPAISTVKVSA